MKFISLNKNSAGFTIVEIILAIAIFPLIVIGISQAFESVSKSYSIARQLNEMYAVLSACPEMDRALEYTSLSSSTNCYPTNTFKVEGGSSNQITYTPSLTVTNTSALSGSDPLSTIPDSKVVEINVNYFRGTGPSLKLRMLVTRNGIAQL